MKRHSTWLGKEKGESCFCLYLHKTVSAFSIYLLVFIFRLLIPCGIVTRLISRSRHALISLVSPFDRENVDDEASSIAIGFGGVGGCGNDGGATNSLFLLLIPCHCSLPLFFPLSNPPHICSDLFPRDFYWRTSSKK